VSYLLTNRNMQQNWGYAGLDQCRSSPGSIGYRFGQ
jgi:hypothetical protein